MNNRWVMYAVAASCAAAVLLGGCIPEDSLEWSEDGSVGLLKIGGELYLVDGQTDALTKIASADIQLLPDISKDGSTIAWAEQIKCDSLPEGLKLLPAGQVKMIEYYAAQAGASLLDAGKLTDGRFPFPDQGLLTPREYRNWAIRYLVESPDPKVSQLLGQEGIKKARELPLHYFQVVVVSRKAPDKKNVVATSLFATLGTRLSPNNQHVAYLMHTQHGQVSNAFEEYGLFIASLKGDAKAVRVGDRVAFGYDWGKDGERIAYLDADSQDLSQDDLILGSLKERIVADAQGRLLATPVAPSDQGSPCTHECTGETSSFAGAVFYPWLKVRYGAGGRVFFSSCLLPLPTAKKDEPRWSLFCYDPVTAAVADVLPSGVSTYTGQALMMTQFALSPDQRNVLLPIKKNRFICYELGTDSMEIPIREDEGFGEEDAAEMLPSWKGNDEITFLVSEKSHFLVKAEEGVDTSSKQIIALKKSDGTTRVMGKNWASQVTPRSEDRPQEK